MKSIAIYKNLPSFLVATLPVATLLQPMWAVNAIVTPSAISDVSSSLSMSFSTTSCDESLKTPTVLSCPEPEHLKMSYVSRGSVDCGGALTLEQAAISPSIRADPSIVEPEALYSLVLVDTTVPTVFPNTFFGFDSLHPLLHYGAVNIQGSILLEGLSLDRTDKLDVFSAYKGPSPTEPNSMWAAEGIESTLFAYEYMLAAQPQTNVPITIPQLDSTHNFDYEAFFTETVGVGFSNLTSSTYFVSGWCVTELPTVSGRQDPTLSPTEFKDQTLPPTNIKDPLEEPPETVQDSTEAPIATPSAMPTMTLTDNVEVREPNDEMNETEEKQNKQEASEAPTAANVEVSKPNDEINKTEEKQDEEEAPEAPTVNLEASKPNDEIDETEEKQDKQEASEVAPTEAPATSSETSGGALRMKDFALVGSLLLASCLS